MVKNAYQVLNWLREDLIESVKNQVITPLSFEEIAKTGTNAIACKVLAL